MFHAEIPGHPVRELLVRVARLRGDGVPAGRQFILDILDRVGTYAFRALLPVPGKEPHV